MTYITYFYSNILKLKASDINILLALSLFNKDMYKEVNRLMKLK